MRPADCSGIPNRVSVGTRPHVILKFFSSQDYNIENQARTPGLLYPDLTDPFVFRVAAASSPQTARGETPRPLPQVYTGVWGRAPADTTHYSILPTHLIGQATGRACLLDGAYLGPHPARLRILLAPPSSLCQTSTQRLALSAQEKEMKSEAWQSMRSPFTIQRYFMTAAVVSSIYFIRQALSGRGSDPIWTILLISVLAGFVIPFVLFLAGEIAWRGFCNARLFPMHIGRALIWLASGIGIMVLAPWIPTERWDFVASVVDFVESIALIMTIYAVGQLVGIWVERRGRAFR